jgi:hypothetical protein
MSHSSEGKQLAALWWTHLHGNHTFHALKRSRSFVVKKGGAELSRVHAESVVSAGCAASG